MEEYSKKPDELADQLLTEHQGPGFKATAEAAEAQGRLIDILKMLIGKFDFAAVIALGKKLVPLVLAKDWWGVAMAVLEFVTQQPVTPPNPTPIVTG